MTSYAAYGLRVEYTATGSYYYVDGRRVEWPEWWAALRARLCAANAPDSTERKT